MKNKISFLFATILVSTFLPLSSMAKSVESEKIIYVMDPHCGWCYGNHKNLDALLNKYESKLPFELLVGGMWVGKSAEQGSAKLLKFIKGHTPRIIKKTGANISQKYYDAAGDSSYTFSSLEPSAAIVLIKELKPEVTFDFVELVQEAIFIDGKRMEKFSTYEPILKALHVDVNIFKSRFLSEKNIENTMREFKHAKEISYGYPSLFISKNGKTHVIAAGEFDVAEVSKEIDKELK